MKPRLLDLFCGAGGCTRGYQLAGFHVTGVDIKDQPRYVGDEFILGDAIDYLRDHGSEYDVIHASPPCKAYTLAGIQWRKNGVEYPDLVGITRELLVETGKPYVIENVPDAGLSNPLILNGPFFGMNLRRTRHFETSFDMPLVLLPKERPSNFRTGRSPSDDDPVVPVGHFSGVARAREVMGIDWMVRDELSQAIPPAYTRYIGDYIMKEVI